MNLLGLITDLKILRKEKYKLKKKDFNEFLSIDEVLLFQESRPMTVDA